MNQNWNKPDENKDGKQLQENGWNARLFYIPNRAFNRLRICSLTDESYLVERQVTRPGSAILPFESEVEAGNVESVTVTGDRITGEFSPTVYRNPGRWQHPRLREFCDLLSDISEMNSCLRLLQQNNVVK
jgi:hypothetical protein